MNLYDMLRMIIQSLARTGTLSKADAFQAIDLIAKLERSAALGTTTTITKGDTFT